MQVKIEYKSFNYFMTVLYVSSAVVEVFTRRYVKTIPVTFHHLIRTVVIMMPCGKNKFGASSAQSLKQSPFILLCPAVIIIHITSVIWRVTVYYVARICTFNGLDKRNFIKLPLFPPDNIGNLLYLITYLGDVGRGETVGFLTERYIPFAMTVEAHHAIETCSGQEDEIVWAMLCIEAVTHLAKVCVALFVRISKQPAFSFKIFPHGR